MSFDNIGAVPEVINRMKGTWGECIPVEQLGGQFSDHLKEQLGALVGKMNTEMGSVMSHGKTKAAGIQI